MSMFFAIPRFFPVFPAFSRVCAFTLFRGGGICREPAEDGGQSVMQKLGRIEIDNERRVLKITYKKVVEK